MESWPLTGRADELRMIMPVLESGTAAVLVGDAGVGKTRLLREVLRAWDGRTEWVVATAAARAVPFGAVSHLGEPQVGERWVVGIDDAHLLDDGSASMLRQLAVRKLITPVVSMRDGEPVSNAVSAMWQDGGRWITIEPLSPEAVDTLLDHAVPGPLHPVSRHRLRRLADGNPLLLRELLAGAGALYEQAGVYHWRGLATRARVAELTETRLRALAPATRAVLEVIACGEPLAMGLLAQVAAPAAVEAAERSGMAVAERSGGRTIVRLAHPLYGETLRANLPASRARAICGRLASALADGPMRRRDDPLLAGSWQLRSGAITHPDVLLAAARQAVARFDLDLAAQLARAAQGHSPEADQLLAEILGRDDRARLAVNRASILYWGLGRVHDADKALRLPTDAAGWELAESARASILLFDGRCRAALAAAERVIHRPAPPQAVVWAAMSGAMAAGLLGRPAQAAGIAERGRMVVEAHAGPAQIGFGTCVALRAAGQLIAARAVADDGYRTAVTSAYTDTTAIWAGLRGVVATAQGNLATAATALREAVALTTESDPSHVLRPCLAGLAEVSALTGDAAAARALITRADHLARADNRLFDAWVELSRAWVQVAEGTQAEAVDTARRAAKLARESEQPTFEALALYHAARLGAAPLVHLRLATLAGEQNGFTRVLSHAARALATRDGAELDRAANALADRAHLLLAAELFAAAARAFRHSGRRGRARTATGRAAALLAGACRGARTPLLDLGGPSAVLTRREREVATLATSRPSKEIAERLELSVHTVNNTLARVYTKLGIGSRRELTELLGATER